MNLVRELILTINLIKMHNNNTDDEHNSNSISPYYFEQFIAIVLFFIAIFYCCSKMIYMWYNYYEGGIHEGEIYEDGITDFEINIQNFTFPYRKFIKVCYTPNISLFPIVCPICFESMDVKNEELLKTRSCGHFCHKECMLRWLRVRNTDVRCLTCQKIL